MSTERTVRVDGAKLLAREWGSGGAAALFWHALGDHTSMQMVEAGPVLAEEFDLRIVAIDAPGFGRSSRLSDERYAMPAMVSFATRLLDALDLDRPAWIGSSWGATVGVHFAAEHPGRLSSLILLDGGYFDEGFDLPADTLPGLQAHFRDQPGFRFPDWESAVGEFRHVIGRWNPDLESYARAGLREEDGEIVSVVGPDLFAACLYFMATAPLGEAQARLGATDLPVLLLAATEPPEMEEVRGRSIARFRERVPGGEVRRVATPHLMLEADPEMVARTIGRWLRDRIDVG